MCAGCGNGLEMHERVVCPACEARMTRIDHPLCLRCGEPFASGAGEDHLCGTCLVIDRGFEMARSAMRYDGATIDLIVKYKFKGDIRLAGFLAGLMDGPLDELAAGGKIDLIVPVPLHADRLRERGYNQAQLLAKMISEQRGIPMDRWVLRRKRATAPQIGLPIKDRRLNVRGAFIVKKPERVADKTVLVVDDVLTTGATVSECSRVLLAAGAAKVRVATLARAVTR